ncbi:Pst1p [Sporobolomyces salmoneus]|uniref:Pst1p n=1 Tax=Sporobolomyces salmoneus TaxID=183962 RepID=UPI00316EFFFF
MALASSASKAVKGQGVCSSNSTCAGFIHFAQICSEKEDSAAIAGCICSAASLEVMNACTDCISSNNVKANANRFSSFCNQASSTLAALAATQTSSTIFPSSTSNSNNDNHSGASALYAPIGVTGMVIGVLGVFSLVM